MKIDPLFIKYCLPVIIGFLAIKLAPPIYKEFFRTEPQKPTGVFERIVAGGPIKCKYLNDKAYCLDNIDNITTACLCLEKKDNTSTVCRYSRYKKEAPRNKEECTFLGELKKEVELKKINQ